MINIKSKKGVLTIKYVILIMIGIITIVGFFDFTVKSYVFREIQSILDISGVSALQAGVDTTKLRDEIFDVNESYVRKEYKRMIAKSINEDEMITSFKMRDSDIDFHTYRSKWGVGVSNKTHYQAKLDSVARVRIKSSEIFDVHPYISKRYYNSFSNRYFTVQYNGTSENGETELLIRSVTRVVYR